jgi:hypothetical protein
MPVTSLHAVDMPFESRRTEFCLWRPCADLETQHQQQNLASLGLLNKQRYVSCRRVILQQNGMHFGSSKFIRPLVCESHDHKNELGGLIYSNKIMAATPI